MRESLILKRLRVLILSLRSLGLLLICLGCGACASMPQTSTGQAFEAKYGEYDYCPIDVTKQTGQYNCGPACLATVHKYWGGDTSVLELLEKYPSAQEKRYLLQELKAISEAEGLKAYALSMEDEPRSELEEQILKGRPLICAVRIPMHLYLLNGIPLIGRNYRALTWALGMRKKHFVVVAGLNLEENKVLVMDPAYGFTTFSWYRFERAWAKMEYSCLLVSAR